MPTTISSASSPSLSKIVREPKKVVSGSDRFAAQFLLHLREEVVQLLSGGLSLGERAICDRRAIGQHAVFHLRQERFVARTKGWFQRLESIKIGRER